MFWGLVWLLHSLGGVEALSEALRANPSLQALDLSNNRHLGDWRQ